MDLEEIAAWCCSRFLRSHYPCDDRLLSCECGLKGRHRIPGHLAATSVVTRLPASRTFVTSICAVALTRDVVELEAFEVLLTKLCGTDLHIDLPLRHRSLAFWPGRRKNAVWALPKVARRLTILHCAGSASAFLNSASRISFTSAKASMLRSSTTAEPSIFLTVALGPSARYTSARTVSAASAPPLTSISSSPFFACLSLAMAVSVTTASTPSLTDLRISGISSSPSLALVCF